MAHAAANLLEVGGTQTAMLNAVNNMLKSAAGIVCPPLYVSIATLTRADACYRSTRALGDSARWCAQ